MEQQLNEEASIYPDYKEVTIPANIAPLNISLINLNDAQLILEGESGESFQIASEKGFFDIPQAKWSKLLNKNKGKKIKLTVCKQVEGKWSALTPFYIFVAQEPIDKYIAYRLIPPDYELWGERKLAAAILSLSSRIWCMTSTTLRSTREWFQSMNTVRL